MKIDDLAETLLTDLHFHIQMIQAAAVRQLQEAHQRVAKELQIYAETFPSGSARTIRNTATTKKICPLTSTILLHQLHRERFSLAVPHLINGQTRFQKCSVALHQAMLSIIVLNMKTDPHRLTINSSTVTSVII